MTGSGLDSFVIHNHPDLLEDPKSIVMPPPLERKMVRADSWYWTSNSVGLRQAATNTARDVALQQCHISSLLLPPFFAA